MASVLPSGWRLKLTAAVVFLALLGFGANVAILVVGLPLIVLALLRPTLFRTGRKPE
jgi:hypothetical protein